ncbi:MAG TPA: DeoR/GlpR transcriptional regulator [Actinomyces sp.]|nr:DeoR/GlpR family DNA-binding transcription regulator [Acidobacteriota bacterium]HHT41204.1 DeoR/GlpR transcriptional regulator [Actinomyces sp.]
MNRQERLSHLADLIVERGSIRVEEAVEELDVSPATVRRDLDALADQQLIVRTRGGASSNPSSGDLPLRYRAVTQPEQKAAIAQVASAMVTPGEVIGFNGGTTTTLVAYEVGVRVSKDKAFLDNDITVVTNAINIANDLAVRPCVRVVVTGGVVRGRSYELIGPLSDLILPKISVDTLFLGINGIDFSTGIYANHEGEAAVNAALVASANRVVVLADSTKLARTAFARIAPLSAVSTVVTDLDANPAHVRALEAQGIEVIQAGQPDTHI